MSSQRSTGPESERAVPGDGVPSAGVDGADPAGAGSPPAPLVPLGATPRISPRCTWQVVEGEAVLLDLHGKRLLGLNRAGSYVLPLLDGDRTVASVAASMAERFGIAVGRAEADLRLFLGELARRGFIEGIAR
jgi:hypothetical protein